VLFGFGLLVSKEGRGGRRWGFGFLSGYESRKRARDHVCLLTSYKSKAFSLESGNGERERLIKFSRNEVPIHQIQNILFAVIFSCAHAAHPAAAEDIILHFSEEQCVRECKMLSINRILADKKKTLMSSILIDIKYRT
jgi:hypothetical protein